MPNEYDLYLPLKYNDGTRIEPAKFEAIEARLIEQFGRLTLFPQPNEGVWRKESKSYRDENVIYRVLSAKVEEARVFFAHLKEEVKRDFRQQEVLVVEREVGTL